jgi:hypothetical protein
MKRFLIETMIFAVALFLLLEGVFRAVIPACRMPFTGIESTFSLMSYASSAGMTGRYTFGRLAEIQSQWRINNQGWNSNIDYRPSAERTHPVIAVVGDSFIEALHVDADKNVAAVLQRLTGNRYDVYSFGMSAMPLSHLLQMTRYISTMFDPDIIVYIVGSRSVVFSDPKSLFFKLTYSNGIFTESPPAGYHPSRLRRIAAYSAVVRYFTYNLGIERSAFFRRPAPQMVIRTEVGKKVSAGEKEKRIRYQEDLKRRTILQDRLIDYVIGAVQKLNGERRQIYVTTAVHRRMYKSGKPESDTAAEQFQHACTQHGIPFLNMADPIYAWYTAHHKRLDFAVNRHWSESGHQAMAEIIYAELVKQGMIEENVR